MEFPKIRGPNTDPNSIALTIRGPVNRTLVCLCKNGLVLHSEVSGPSGSKYPAARGEQLVASMLPRSSCRLISLPPVSPYLDPVCSCFFGLVMDFGEDLSYRKTQNYTSWAMGVQVVIRS